jgi:sigma-B regulation protein RsbU (phosphoserine phosphatase)
MRVLIAEDDRVSRRMLQRQLEQWGHEVVPTENGIEAWNHICESEFSLVISDWMMPEMDGLELVRRIRGATERGYVYVILLTAKTETDDIVKGMDEGADDFLSKPFDRNELRVRVRAGQRIIELERSLADRNEQLQAANQRMSDDLEAAARVQQALLPATLPDIPGVNLAWSFRPCDELAGDFLNVFQIDEKHLAMYVADVSGHGVASSLLSVTISRVLTAQASSSSILVRSDESGHKSVVPPAEVMRELNRRFQMDDSGMYFTLVYAMLNTDSLEFQYASAGHPPILRIPASGKAAFLGGTGLAVGWDVDGDFDQHEVHLKSGDRLFLYSDGVPEAMNGELEPFEDHRLIEACSAGRTHRLQSTVDSLLDSVQQWCAPVGPKDDVSILAAEIE